MGRGWPEPHLRDIPQLAYQPHRGLSDALRRAIQHVTDVRAACKRHRRTRRELKLGIGKTQLEGGICFALDLSQAFDMVDRADLIATLEQAHAETQPIWHQGARGRDTQARLQTVPYAVLHVNGHHVP